MDILFEFIGELIMEGSMELSKNKKISKWIRYPLITLLLLFFTTITLGILALGLYMTTKNMVVGLFFVGVGIFLLIAGIIKLKKLFQCKKRK